MRFEIMCIFTTLVSHKHIATCMGGGCVTKITGSISDDWIYYHFGYNLSLNYN
jgi:hypothetical protein